jgi:DNA-binding phage protein
MLTADHDDFIVEQLREDPEFFRIYCEEAMKEQDPFVLKESFQYIIRAKGFDCNLEIKEREVA